MFFQKSKNKYHAKKTDGYDSRKEASYAVMLKSLMGAKDPAMRVVKIEEQVKYELLPRQDDEHGKLLERAVSYIADFRVTYADGRVDVLDVKGCKKGAAYANFVLKRKLLLFRHGVRVVEV